MASRTSIPAGNWNVEQMPGKELNLTNTHRLKDNYCHVIFAPVFSAEIDHRSIDCLSKLFRRNLAMGSNNGEQPISGELFTV
jgi:hypothetical protein